MSTPYSRSYNLETIFETMITPTYKDDKELVKSHIEAKLGSPVYIMSKYFNLSGILGKGETFDYTISREEGALFGHFNFNDVKRIFTDEQHPDSLTIELK